MSDAATLVAWTIGGAVYGAVLVVVLSRLAGDKVPVDWALAIAAACGAMGFAAAGMAIITGAWR